jgi:hypothetical protein
MQELPNIINKLNELIVAFVGFSCIILTKFRIQEAKSPVNISSGSVARRDLIQALKG